MESITLLITYTIKQGLRQEFLQAVNDCGVVAKSRLDDGCLSYAYYMPIDQPDQVLLIEKWTSEAKQQAHLQLPHAKAFLPIKVQYVVTTNITKLSS